MFMGTGTLKMAKSEETLCSMSRSEKYSISQTHPFLPEQARPSLGRGGWKSTYLTKHKQAGDIVGERGAQATKMLKNLEVEVQEIEANITKDEKSLQEMDNDLRVMQLEADRMQRKIEEEEMICAAMAPGAGLGSALGEFDNMMKGVKDTYKHLRGRHTDAINILKTEFEYSPCFKRGGNVKSYQISGGNREFSAAYLTLAKDPSKIPPAKPPKCKPMKG